tara:strand:+ start:564 stop:986 length:423 start_codon:yes stop_codon:yes gene_type:complete
MSSEALELMEKAKTSERMWVVFSGHSELKILHFLKKGFRHCFVVLNDGKNWITFDPLSHHTEIVVQKLPFSFDLIGWLTAKDYKILPANPNYKRTKPAPLMLFTCVEAVKRVLGIHDRYIITPYQLYKFLKQNNQIKKEN